VLRLGANSLLSVAGQWVNDTWQRRHAGPRHPRGLDCTGDPDERGSRHGCTATWRWPPARRWTCPAAGWLSGATSGGKAGKVQAGNGGAISLTAFDHTALDTLDLRGWSGGDASRTHPHGDRRRAGGRRRTRGCGHGREDIGRSQAAAPAADPVRRARASARSASVRSAGTSWSRKAHGCTSNPRAGTCPLRYRRCARCPAAAHWAMCWPPGRWTN